MTTKTKTLRRSPATAMAFCLSCDQKMQPSLGNKCILWCKKCRYSRSIYPFNIHLYDKKYADEYIKRAQSDIGHLLNLYRMQFVQKYLPKRKDTAVFDFGCGAGVFAKLASQHWTVSAYDINPIYREYWKRDTSLWEAVDFLKEMERDPHYDCITFFDSLEHVEDVHGFVRFYRPKFYIASIPILPDNTDLNTWKHFKPTEHLHYFSRTALLQFFGAAGYTYIGESDGETKLGRVDINTFAFKRIR